MTRSQLMRELENLGPMDYDPEIHIKDISATDEDGDNIDLHIIEVSQNGTIIAGE